LPDGSLDQDAFFVACYNGDVDVVQVGGCSCESGTNKFSVVCKRIYFVIKAMLAAGIDISHTDEDGNTAWRASLENAKGGNQ